MNIDNNGKVFFILFQFLRAWNSLVRPCSFFSVFFKREEGPCYASVITPVIGDSGSSIGVSEGFSFKGRRWIKI